MKTLITPALALAMLLSVSCSKDSNGVPAPGDADVAYLSVKLPIQAGTRASGEDNGSNESDLKTLYLGTFDESGNVLEIPGTSLYYIHIDNATATPDAVKIAGASKQLLVIANPGNALLGVIRSIGTTSSFSGINAAITDTAVGEIIDDVTSITKGFAMINSGSEAGKSPGDNIEVPLTDISDHIVTTASTDYDDAAAKAQAEANRVEIAIERLASKLHLKAKAPAEMEVKPAGATFEFGNWTIDAINTAFYPFAEKTLLSADHTAGKYPYNFYTRDPNFDGQLGDGLAFTHIDPQTYEPQLVTPWLDAAATTYCLENTMAAAEQKFGNATRLIIKGKYYPEAGWTGDWFSFAGVNYETLSDLQDAYSSAAPDSNLADACDMMYGKIADYASLNSLSITGTNFGTLVQDDLDKLSPYGGEIIKDGRNPVIRWYQDGLNYYYYEIRHDDMTQDEMAFGKYGVVRNNWYAMTLGSVDGAGTPWYPDINNPGPGDPDPEEPLDESTGYLGIEIDIMPWVIWEREIGI